MVSIHLYPLNIFLESHPHSTWKCKAHMCHYLISQQRRYPRLTLHRSSALCCSPCGCVRACRAAIWWTWCVLAGWCWGPRGSQLKCSAELPGCLQRPQNSSISQHPQNRKTPQRTLVNEPSSLHRSTGNTRCCSYIPYHTFKSRCMCRIFKWAASSFYAFFKTLAGLVLKGTR